jgi:hypothetical protein
VNDETVWFVARHAGPELLDGPLGRRMFRHVPMQDPTAGDLKHKKYVDESKRGGDRHEEIAGQHLTGVVSQERAPRLRTRAVTRRNRPPHVSADRPRRQGNAHLQQ